MALREKARLNGVKRYAKFVLIGAVVLAFVLVSRQLPLEAWVESLKTWVSDLGAIGPIVFALIYVAATVLMLPASLLTIAAGAVFGLFPGFVTVWTGANVGAALAFLVSRFFARRRVEAWAREKPSFEVIDKAVAKEGWKIVFLTRLSPVFPFNFQNYAYGLTGVSFWHYVMASLVGMIPGSFLYVYIGVAGREVAAGAGNALLYVGLLATIVVTIFVTRTAKRALREAGV